MKTRQRPELETNALTAAGSKRENMFGVGAPKRKRVRR